MNENPPLHRRLAIAWSTLLLFVLPLVPGARAAASDDDRARPNIILILADDLGWRDAGFMGSDFHETPHLDRLAAQGLVCTQAYANCANCAPSRAAIMSGQYAPRTGIYTVGAPDRGRSKHRRLLTPPNRRSLDGGITTLAESLKAAGYATASIGKWHLGAGPEEGPLGQGFEVNLAGNLAGHPRSYFSPYRNEDLPDGDTGEYLTARLTDEAIDFVREHREDPFFLYLPYFAVHTPIQPEADRLKEPRSRTPGNLHDDPRYAAMVEGLDANVGRLLHAVEELDLADRTLVVFTSDNGGNGSFTRMTPLRGFKGTFYEGGIRVPFIARWPGHVPAGRRCETPIIGLDLYPTLLAAAGAALPQDQPVDGVNLLPLLTRGEDPAPRALYWHFPAYLQARRDLDVGRWRTTPCGAIRRDDYKLIEFFEDGRLELYDLAHDPGEARSLATALPEKTRELHDELIAWRDALGAPVPRQANPDFRPAASSVTQREGRRGPNIIYILADDLGYAELGCYGQEKLETPHLDRLAAEGMRFTQHYAGSAVCAPSRCVLLTGRHTGHAYIRNNRGKPVVGQEPIPDATVTLGELLQQRGYTTCCTGKWGLGGPDTTGLPNQQGFDHWFGYLDQWNAHTHYPQYLWRNGKKVILEENADGRKRRYSHDLFTAEAIEFIRARERDEPFFLYVAYAVPHVSLHVPEDSLAQYEGRWPETPFEGGHYEAHPTPRAAYAAMVSRMDRDVGRIMAVLDELDLDDDTLVMFSSDNGPTYAGGADSAFFESAGPLRGLKGSLFEGGIRVPLIARWPGHVPAGRTSDHPCASWDLLPTFIELAGGEPPPDIDGISMLPVLLGRPLDQGRHTTFYWELGRQQALRAGDWKLLRRTSRKDETTIFLFNLRTDPGEQENLADRYPAIREQMLSLIRRVRTPSDVFLSVYDDGR
ncbi:MAG: sulfatase-like hydrolase/transferase [Planctomycetota bacterium]|nr:sulfatase-like hydrolase/transferase [Planctomycetota bacterium]